MFLEMIHDFRQAVGPRADGRVGRRCCSRPVLKRCLLAAVFVAGACARARAAAPVAADGTATIEPGQTLSLVLEATDGDGDTLDYIIVSPLPTLGTVKVGSTALATDDLPYTLANHGNTITFIADADAHGDAVITFKANDGTTDSDSATMTVAVNLPPTAGATTTFFTTPSTDLKFNLPASDPDSDTLTYAIQSLPGHGRLKIGSTVLADESLPYEATAASITYQPDPGFHGQDQFLFVASDETADSDSIAVTIEVNTTPAPAEVNETVLPNGLTTLTLSAVDADKDPVQYVIASLPDHGVLSVAGVDITADNLPLDLGVGIASVDYKVDAGYRGTDTFHYRAKDAVSISDRAVATIWVNTPPVAPTAEYTVTEGAAVAGTLLPTDKDGDSLTLKISRLGEHGALKLDGKAVGKTGTSYAVPAAGISFSYTFTTGFTGQDSFAWIAGDGIEDSPPGEVVMNVQAVAGDPSADPSTPTDDPAADDTQPPPSDAPAPAACGPLGGGFVALAAVWATIIGPRSFRRGRALANARI